MRQTRPSRQDDLPDALHRVRKHGRRSFAATDYIALLDAAHQQLGAPTVRMWDNLNTHLSNDMRR